MTTLLDIIADLEKLAADLKAIDSTIWEKELQTFTPVGEEKTSQGSADTTATEPSRHWKKFGHFLHRNPVQG